MIDSWTLTNKNPLGIIMAYDDNSESKYVAILLPVLLSHRNRTPLILTYITSLQAIPMAQWLEQCKSPGY